VALSDGGALIVCAVEVGGSQAVGVEALCWQQEAAQQEMFWGRGPA